MKEKINCGERKKTHDICGVLFYHSPHLGWHNGPRREGKLDNKSSPLVADSICPGCSGNFCAHAGAQALSLSETVELVKRKNIGHAATRGRKLSAQYKHNPDAPGLYVGPAFDCCIYYTPNLTPKPTNPTCSDLQPAPNLSMPCTR